MDSFYEILGVLIILFSILQSFWSKKKEEKEKQEGLRKKQDESVRDSQEADASGTGGSSYSRELERMQREKEEYSEYIEEGHLETYKEKTLPGENAPEEAGTWFPEDEFKDTSERIQKTATRIEQAQAPEYEQRSFDDAEAELVKTLERSARELKKKAEQEKTEKRISKKAKELKKALRDPASIRDAVLLKEILDKPKALRQ